MNIENDAEMYKTILKMIQDPTEIGSYLADLYEKGNEIERGIIVVLIVLSEIGLRK